MRRWQHFTNEELEYIQGALTHRAFNDTGAAALVREIIQELQFRKDPWS